jgi:hypothetical protein
MSDEGPLLAWWLRTRNLALAAAGGEWPAAF